jgi:glutaconate CoA-transferase subunit A
MGLPFLPVRGVLGSAYPAHNPAFQIIIDPYNGEEIAVVKALRPEVTILHAYQGDHQGNIMISRRSDLPLAIKASNQVIVTVEERVQGELQEDREHRFIPYIYLTALVHCPQGAAPTALPGRYDLDRQHIARYMQEAKKTSDFAAYLDEFVFGEGVI